MEIQIILVSDDHNYSYGVLSELTKLEHKIKVKEVDWEMISALEPHEIVSQEDIETPTIMMLDFGFRWRPFDGLIDRLAAVRRRMAIECLVMRPPADDDLHEHLTDRGVLLFDKTPWPLSSAEVVH